MKKALLQKPIREVLYGIGFTHVKNDDYARLSNDGQVKLIVRIPDGNKGFIIGAQLADYGAFDGLLSHAQLRQYGFAYELAYASTKDYSDEAIISAANRLTKTCKQYIDGGLSALQNRGCKKTVFRHGGAFSRTQRIIGKTRLTPLPERVL